MCSFIQRNLAFKKYHLRRKFALAISSEKSSFADFQKNTNVFMQKKKKCTFKSISSKKNSFQKLGANFAEIGKIIVYSCKEKNRVFKNIYHEASLYFDN